MSTTAKIPHGQMKARAAAIIVEAGVNKKTPFEEKMKIAEKVAKQAMHKEPAEGLRMVNFWLRQGTQKTKKAAEKAEFNKRASAKRQPEQAAA